jgi:HEAT repeat protein
MKRLAGVLIFVIIFAGYSAAQDLDYFRSVLTSGNVEAKRTVLLQIRELRTDAASRVAAGALTDTNEMVRATAASAVNGLAPAEASLALMPLLNDRSPFVRTEAAYGLGRSGDASAVTALIKTLQNDNAKEARAAAAIALGQIGDLAAVNALADVFRKGPSEDNEFIRRSAARTIGQIAERHHPSDMAAYRTAVPALIKALGNSKETDDTRREAATSLGQIGDPAALNVLRSQLNSPDYYLVANSRLAIERIESGK